MVVSTSRGIDATGNAYPVICRFSERFTSFSDARRFTLSILPEDGYVSRYPNFENMLQLRSYMQSECQYVNYLKRYDILPYSTLNVFDAGEIHTCIENPRQDVREYEFDAIRNAYFILRHEETKSLIRIDAGNFYNLDVSGITRKSQEYVRGLNGYTLMQFSAKQNSVSVARNTPSLDRDLHIRMSEHPAVNPDELPNAVSLYSVATEEFTEAIRAWASMGDTVSQRLVNNVYGYSLSIYPCHSQNATDVQFDGDKLKYRDARRTDGKSVYVTTKPRRVIEAILHPSFRAGLKDSDYETFANRLKARVSLMSGKFSEVSGSDIQHWYSEQQYASDDLTGSLGKSCMRDESSDYFCLYADNDDKIRMLILINGNGDLLGRALLWTLDNGHTLMDRIYASDANIQAFIAYASEHGYIRKTYQNYTSQTSVTLPDGTECDRVYTVSLRYGHHDEYPYMDTMIYASSDRETWSNAYHGMRFVHQETNGTYERVTESGRHVSRYDDSYTCSDCGRELDYPDTYCELCSENHHSCRNCSDDAGENDYCDYCSQYVCSECGQYDQYRDDEHELCRDCYSERYTLCEQCENEMPCDDATIYQNRLICPECRANWICEDCDHNALTADDKIASDDAGLSRHVCSECLPDAIAAAYRVRQIDAGQNYLPGMYPLISFTSTGNGYYTTINHERRLRYGVAY
jgi:hypothetical protein